MTVLARTWAFVRRDFLFETSYRLQSVYRLAGVAFTIVSFYFLAGFVGGESAQRHLAPYGGDYFSFVLIGVSFMGFFNVGLTSYTASIRQFMTTGVFEPMIASECRPLGIMINNLVWPFGLELAKAFLYLLAGCAFLGGRIDVRGVPAALLILSLALITFASIGLISGSLLVVVKRGDPVTWFFSSGSSLLGGTIFPVSILPVGLRNISILLPVTHALEGLRLALLSGHSIAQLLPQIEALLVFAVLTLPLALLSVNSMFELAKRRGSLGSY